MGGVSISAVYFEPEALTLFRAMTTVPTMARRILYNEVILGLKNASIWTKLDALYLFAAHTSQAALLNIKAPGTYTGTPVSSPTFIVDSGYDCSTPGYISTGFNPTTAGGNYATNSATLFGWQVDAGSSAGVIGETAFADYIITNDGGADVAVGGIQFVPSGWQSIDGLYAASLSSGNVATYINAVAKGTGSGTPTLGNATLRIGNVGGIGLNDLFGVMKAGGFGASLTAAQHTLLYNILYQYLHTVGAV